MEKYTVVEAEKKGLKSLELEVINQEGKFKLLYGLKSKIFENTPYTEKKEAEEKNEMEKGIDILITPKKIETVSNEKIEDIVTNKEKLGVKLKQLLENKVSTPDIKYLYKIITIEKQVENFEEIKRTHILFAKIENLKNGLYKVSYFNEEKHIGLNFLSEALKEIFKMFGRELIYEEKEITFEELKEFKTKISDYKLVDLEKIDEMAEKIYQSYLEFELIPLEVNNLDDLF